MILGYEVVVGSHENAVSGVDQRSLPLIQSSHWWHWFVASSPLYVGEG